MRLKHHVESRELPSRVYGNLEWRLGCLKTKDGKGTQIAPIQCNAEEGSSALALDFGLSLLTLEIKFFPHRKQIESHLQRPICYHFSEIITLYFDNNGTH